MAIKQASYMRDASHPADTDRLVLEGLLNPFPAVVSGAAGGVGSTPGDLLVTQNGTPNMSVNVAAGHAWIDGTETGQEGKYHGYNDATLNVPIAAAHATLARKDLIVARVRDGQYSGATNNWAIEAVTGTPAGSPAEPAVPASSVVLALVDVAAAAASITNANITDRRRRASALGGIVVCTSTTRPTTGLYEGLFIYETDTDKAWVWDGTNWTYPKNVAGGALGYAPVTANQGPFTAETDLTGLSVTITAVTGRRLKISGHVLISSSVADGAVRCSIFEGGTLLNFDQTVGRTDAMGLNPWAVVTPSAGSHTYKLSGLRAAGTGNLTMIAAGQFPAFILVEDIGV